MAIAFVTAVAASTATATSITIAVPVSGSTPCLLSSVAVYDGDVVTGATYNGVAMTLIAKQQNNAAGGSSDPNRYLYLYRLVGPAAGTNNLVVSRTGSADITASAAVYSGVDQTNPIDTFNSSSVNTTGTTTVSVTTSVNNTWLVGTHSSRNSNPSSTSGTERLSLTDNDFVDLGPNTPAGSFGIGWTWGAEDKHCIIVAALSPSTAVAVNSGFLAFMPN